MHDKDSYRAHLKTASERLAGARIELPAREARHLMQHICGKDAAGLIGIENDPMPADQRGRFFALVERRATGEPYEHLTNESWFYGLAFHCTSDTLIPRLDSEVVVDEALARLPLGRDVKVADLGTGTGCLLITLLANHPGLQGVGIEQSPPAAAVATRNLATHNLSDRGHIETMSWSDWAGWAEMDLIISNPPYIRTDVIDTLDESVRAFEPHVALDGGASGLEAYESIIDLAAKQMKPDAWLVFEIGFDQREAVMALLDRAGFNSIGCRQDSGQRDRVVCARR